MTVYLYVIRRSDGARKVGYSARPKVRCASIANSLGMVCTLEHKAKCPDAEAAEGHAHALLMAKRLKDEWFSVELGEAMDAVAAGVAAVAAGNPTPRPPRFRANTIMLFSPTQCRAGRAMLDLSQEDLAVLADVGIVTLRKFEKGNHVPQRRFQRLVRMALERRGLHFPDPWTVSQPPDASAA